MAEDRKNIEKEHDEILSKYIRMRDGGTCYCGFKNQDYLDKEGNTKPGWLGMDNGHLFTRSLDATRWDEKNCHCCCRQCNTEHEGSILKYKRWFIYNYGQYEYDELEIQSTKKFKPDIQWHLDKIEELKDKIEKLKKENYNL